MNRHHRSFHDILRADASAQRIVDDIRKLRPATRRMLVHIHVLVADYRHAKKAEITDIAAALACYGKMLSHVELAEELLWQWPEFRRLTWTKSVGDDSLPDGGVRFHSN